MNLFVPKRDTLMMAFTGSKQLAALFFYFFKF